MEQQSRIMNVGGQRLNVAVAGAEDADRTLLICNGIGASVDTLVPFAEHFKRTRLIGFDVPGVGASPTPALPYRLTNLTRMLGYLLTEMDIDVVDVFGVSWGGALAQQFVRDHPERSRSLTIAATTAGIVMVPGNVSVLKKMATPRRYTDPDYMMKIGAEIYGGELAFNRELLRDHALAMQGGSSRGYLYQLLAIAGWTSYFWLPQVTLPTLVLTGKDDPIVPPLNGRILAKRLPNATLEDVDCGHMFVLTQAEAIADRVEAFLHEDQRRSAAAV
ncbi:MAG: poly(3-hydroxyalkanoate) depolymerase [Dinoroseobacter sp.]|nr:poly(3-hydroxyalkanoate) depolymerase [Dinoroseobacter sp.]